jgi:glucuronate isomerase
LFAEDMLKGELPNDEKWIGSIAANICYYNAVDYFNQSSAASVTV